MDFEKCQRVFTQDGSEYEFDHEAAGFAFVHPIVVVQTTSYRGDDFEEHEVVADHLVRFPIAVLAGSPWVQKINQDARDAIEEKTKALADINLRIGVASTDLRVKERELADFEAGLDGEMKDILSRHKMLRDFKRFIGATNLYFISSMRNGSGVPSMGSGKVEGELRLKADGEIYQYWPKSYEERRGDFFATKCEYENAVLNRFNERTVKTVEADADWKRKFPFLTVSSEVIQFIEDEKEAKRQKEISAAADAVARAQEAFDKLNADA